MRAGNGDRSVAGQPRRPVLEPDAERFTNQQAAKARAVDEQVARDMRAVFKNDGSDKTALIILLDLCDFAFCPLDALRLCASAQIFRITARIELKGIAEFGERRIGLVRLRPHEPACFTRHRRHRIGVEQAVVAKPFALKPEMLEFDTHHIDAVMAKGVNVTMP